MFTNKNVLITGGSGMIGRQLVPLLLEKGANIFIADLNEPINMPGKFTFLKKVYMITSASSNVLVYGKADANSVSAGGQAGNLKVDAYAEFDPKTGCYRYHTLRPSYLRIN